MGVVSTIILAAAAAATAGIQASQQHQAAKKATNAARDEAERADRLATETRAEQTKMETESKKRVEELKAAAGVSAEEARKDDMKRRRKTTKTLLTGPLGTMDTAITEKKTLLGA